MGRVLFTNSLFLCFIFCVFTKCSREIWGDVCKGAKSIPYSSVPCLLWWRWQLFWMTCCNLSSTVRFMPRLKRRTLNSSSLISSGGSRCNGFGSAVECFFAVTTLPKTLLPVLILDIFLRKRMKKVYFVTSCFYIIFLCFPLFA